MQQAHTLLPVLSVTGEVERIVNQSVSWLQTVWAEMVQPVVLPFPVMKIVFLLQAEMENLPLLPRVPIANGQH